MSASEIRNIVEAALLAAGKSLTFSELSQLFEDQDRPEPAAIRSALASLAGQIERGEASVAAARSSLQEAASAIDQARANLDLAQQSLKRQEDLSKDGLTTREALDRCVTRCSRDSRLTCCSRDRRLTRHARPA